MRSRWSAPRESSAIGAGLAPRRGDARDLGAFGQLAGERIEQCELLRAVEQRLMFVLAVDLDQSGSSACSCVRRRGARH